VLGAQTTPANSLTFGSFTLLAKLARGDIGDLYLARSQGAGGFEKLVIIKRIHPEFMGDKEISEIFLSEAQTAARIEHPNVRLIYEIGGDDAHYYIALEYLEGVPLVDVLLARKRDRRLADPRLIASLISQACQGLHAAHSVMNRGQPVVHGDLNPRSIFVTESGTTKLLDFDIVEMRGALAKRHGFVRRTIAYMSPEEVRSNICDLRSDIFSLGVVAWEAITSRRLFKQPSRDQTLAAIDRGQIPNAKDLQPGISDALNATIMRALNRDPSLRFQTAQEFGSALDRAMLGEGSPLTPVAISTLIKDAFAPTLQQQREFVRSSRKNQDEPTDVRGPTPVDDFEKPTVVGSSIDPDDWNTDEPATTVGGADLIAAIEAMATDAEVMDEDTGAYAGVRGQTSDPFQTISENVDFSQVGHTPIWQDTRNLVLSEVDGAAGQANEYEAETGAVVLPSADAFDIADYALSESSAGPTAPGKGAKPRPQSPTALPFGPPPEIDSTPDTGLGASPAAAYPRVTSSLAANYDRRLGTLATSHEPNISTSKINEKSLPDDIAASTSKSTRTKLLLAGTFALVAVAALTLYLRSGSSPAPAPEASTMPVESVRSESAAAPPSSSSGAGAAAGILAAASKSQTEAAEPIVIPAPQENVDVPVPVPDAGPEKLATAPPVVVPPPKAPVVSKSHVVPKRPKSTKNRKTAAKSGKASAKVIDKTRKKPIQPSGGSKATSTGPGFLTVAATPYATVFVDGKKKGITPIVKLKLAPGLHRVKLVSSVGGKTKALKVHIKSGDVSRQNVTF